MTSAHTTIIVFGVVATLAAAPQAFGAVTHERTQAPQQREITVLADNVAKPALLEAIASFERSRPDIVVRPHFAGSRVVAERMRTGADPDAVVLPSSEARAIAPALGDITPAFGDHTTILVSRDARTRIHGAADLVAPGVRLGAGRAGTALADLGAATVARLAEHGDFSARLAANVAEEEHDSARSALADAVADGSLDAAIMFASDAVDGKSYTLALPPAARVTAAYSAAVVRASDQPAAAREFVTYLTSPAGAAIFRAHGHDPAT